MSASNGGSGDLPPPWGLEHPGDRFPEDTAMMEVDAEDANSDSRAFTPTVFEEDPLQPVPGQAAWPSGVLPVEIFELITSFLSRNDVKTLRLVCREFAAKATAQYFRNVVVPFRSELYGQMNRDRDGNLIYSTANLFSNGMRIFQSFGPDILRFALSLELDEDDLAYPPMKPAQKAVPAFWGIYRWPHDTYHRYTELEGLEQTADETDGMKEALDCLTRVSNLGLCCDAGLGFLLGPDHSAKQSSDPGHPVFATRDWRQDVRRTAPETPPITVADFNDVTRGPAHLSGQDRHAHRLLESMASEAGYTASQQGEAIRLMLETERTTLQEISFYERSTPKDSGGRWSSHGHRRRSSRDSASNDYLSQFPLWPAELTKAQRELLLELEWAHRAMIQSFVICLVDNSATNHFDSVTTLTIAKIPSGHLNILNRDDLWSALRNLRNVFIGVIADWRCVSKDSFGFINDQALSPSGAVSKAFELLNTHIGERDNIESVHFEWICGGELAPSRFQRNQYVLPAPFVQGAALMASPTVAVESPDRVVALPYVKHLSLKNCWVSPHIFIHAVRQMALSSLEKLELESVSLSGTPTLHQQLPLWQDFPPPHVAQPNAAAANPQPNGATVWGLLLGGLGGGVGMPPPPPPAWAAPPPPPPPAWDSDAESRTRFVRRTWGSWVGILDHFSPGRKLHETLSRRLQSIRVGTRAERFDRMLRYIPDVMDLQRDEKDYKLKHLALKSCGYVAVDHSHIDTRDIIEPFRPALADHSDEPHPRDLAPIMQKSRDKLLGIISPQARAPEVGLLENAFGMEFGWQNAYPEKVALDAVADGIECPGQGRFSGVLEQRASDIWASDDSDESDLSDVSMGYSDSDTDSLW